MLYVFWVYVYFYVEIGFVYLDMIGVQVSVQGEWFFEDWILGVYEICKIFGLKGFLVKGLGNFIELVDGYI